MTRLAIVAALLPLLAHAVEAAMPNPAAQSPIVHIIGNDRGGKVPNRDAEIRWMNRQGHAARIEGRYCLSSCTMYLGVRDVCVMPHTTFGFHGPTYYGQPLAPEHFEKWSQIIAAHYPTPIRDWWMADARYTLTGYRAVLGSELIRLGVEQCQ